MSVLVDEQALNVKVLNHGDHGLVQLRRLEWSKEVLLLVLLLLLVLDESIILVVKLLCNKLSSLEKTLF